MASEPIEDVASSIDDTKVVLPISVFSFSSSIQTCIIDPPIYQSPLHHSHSFIHESFSCVHLCLFSLAVSPRCQRRSWT